MDIEAICNATLDGIGLGDLGRSVMPEGGELPRGRRIDLDCGEAFYRESDGPGVGGLGVGGSRSVPTVLLLHGWMATGGLNWFRAFSPLGQSFRVLAPDLRGHGRGLRSLRPFRLEDCADDAAELIRAVSDGPVIAVGYSMGGAVAKLLWHRHPELVSGLVLCATGPRLIATASQRRTAKALLGTLAGTARLTQIGTYLPRKILEALLPLPSFSDRHASPLWAGAEMARHDWRMVLEAGADLGRYDATPWLEKIDVPTTVIVTDSDAAIDRAVQLDMARTIPGARTRRIAGGHLSCASATFGDVLVEACEDLASPSAVAA